MQSQNEPSAMKVAIEICEEFAEHWEQQARSGDNTGASDHRADAARQIIAELRNVHTAPPAQTALTDDARDAIRRETLKEPVAQTELALTDDEVWQALKDIADLHSHPDDVVQAGRALLTAAQSASGDMK
jgi:selenocysteine lyase/cysteine desulfurase